MRDLPVMCYQMLQAMDDKKLTIVVLLDFSKAFDSIDHNKLLSKLKSLGTSSFALDWFRSYLKDRRQYVRIGSEHSTLCGLSHGVPQGSILGPALFNIYISMIYLPYPNLVHWNRMLMTQNCFYLFKLKILLMWLHRLMTILKE